MPAIVGVGRAQLAGAGNAWTPARLPNLKLWLEVGRGTVLDATGYAGSGTVSQAANAVTGTSTLFTKEVFVGDTLSGTGLAGTVTAIADDTHLTLSATGSASGIAYTITPSATTLRIAQLSDLSGQGNHATASGTARPLYRPGIAGQPIAEFVRSGGHVMGTVNTLPASVPYLVALVGCRTQSVNVGYFIGSDTNGGIAVACGATQWTAERDNTTAEGSWVAANPVGVPVERSLVVDGANWTRYHKGVLDGAPASVNVPIAGRARLGEGFLGATRFADCYLQAVVIALTSSASDRALLDAYLMGRYGN